MGINDTPTKSANLLLELYRRRSHIQSVAHTARHFGMGTIEGISWYDYEYVSTVYISVIELYRRHTAGAKTKNRRIEKSSERSHSWALRPPLSRFLAAWSGRHRILPTQQERVCFAATTRFLSSGNKHQAYTVYSLPRDSLPPVHERATAAR